MFRRLAWLTVLGLVVAACGSGALNNPRDIVAQSVEAMTELNTAHVDLAVDGTASIAELGGEVSLDGTHLAGDFDLEAGIGSLTFEVPTLLGLNGSAIFTGETAFFRTSLTGPMWMSQPVTGSDDPLGAAADPDRALAELDAFLDKEGVELEKLDDVECGDASCYRLALTVPTSLLAEDADSADVDVSMLGDELMVTMLFDKSTLYLTRASTEIEAEGTASLTIVLSLTDFDAPVEVSPPPSDQVQEGDFPFAP